MLSSQDITKLIAHFATKRELSDFQIETRTAFAEMRSTLNTLVIAVDGIARTVEDLRIEHAAMKYQLNKNLS